MADNFFGLTDIGQVASNNEDAFLVRELADQFLIAAVIDGVGGYEGGEVAASIARDAIAQAFGKSFSDPEKKLRDAFTLANEKIYQGKKKNPQHQNMACVLSVALIDQQHNQFYYAHLGDTRLYLYRDNSLVKITNDHSFVGFLEDSGRLTEDDARAHPKRNEINKALGFDPNLNLQSAYIDTGHSPFLPGDMLLLCSDGLTDMVSSKEIIHILHSKISLHDQAKALIEAANDSGGKDNITVVLVKNTRKPVEHEALRPVSAKKNGEEQTVVNRESADKKKPRPKKLGWLIGFLVLVCLGLAGIIVWQNKDYFANTKDPVISAQPIVSPLERQLLDSLLSSSDSLILFDSVFQRLIPITDTVLLDKDSFYLDGRNIILAADSGFNGAAILIPASVRYIRLQNITLKDFRVGIANNGGKLHLINTRFINCGLAIERHFKLPQDKYVTGVISDSIFSIKDSLPK